MSCDSFSVLWWHFGPHGPQDVHVHSCLDHEGCSSVMIGEGRDCSGGKQSHRYADLDEMAALSRATDKEDGRG